jgi:hypothetical protein
MRTLAFAMMIGTPGIAAACDGNKEQMASNTAADTTAAPAAADPAHCAKNADLVGSNCSFSTGMMAQRVLDEGAAYTFTGTLGAAATQLASHVAAPWSIGPEGGVRVIANEVVEQLAASGRVSLEGRILEVDGVRYFVATKARVLNS